MAALASSLINWSALWKIVLAALIGGGGVAIAFGFMLLGLEYARAAKTRGIRIAHWALVGACGVCCGAAVVIGIYTMIEKGSPQRAGKSKPSALSIPAARVGLIVDQR